MAAHRRPPVRDRGVTLVELLVAMVVMSVVMALAVPAYRGYVQRTNRGDATAALLRIASGQERFFLQQRRYALTAAELSDPPPDGLGIDGTERGYYELSLAARDPGGFVATATVRPTGDQGDDTDCWRLTIDDTGRRGASSQAGADTTDDCWR